MIRAFITLDETNPNLPVPDLHVNGHVFLMSEQELHRLVEDAQWALGAIVGTRAVHWGNLADKYRSKS